MAKTQKMFGPASHSSPIINLVLQDTFVGSCHCLKAMAAILVVVSMCEPCLFQWVLSSHNVPQILQPRMSHVCF